MRIIYKDSRAAIYHGDALQGLPCEVDCIITDPPYSERTHAKCNYEVLNSTKDDSCRRAISYASWSSADVVAAATSWSAFCKGWIVVITDHVLVRNFEEALSAAGRFVFAPLPFYSPGSRVRLAGDGPSSWTCWIIVARPKRAPYSKWGTLPGGYVFPPERMALVGGKPLRLMNALVADYSRPGDLVCDPCCGAGTTGRAALDLGRRFVGIDISEKHCELTKQRLAQQVLAI